MSCFVSGCLPSGSLQLLDRLITHSSTSPFCPPTVHALRSTLWDSQLSIMHKHGRRYHSNRHIHQAPHVCSSSSGSSSSPPDPAASSPSSSSSSGAAGSEAWSLMGRVVSADRLVLGAASRQRLVLLAAAKAAGISPEDMAGRLQELVLLLPDLASLLPSLHPRTLATLGADTQGVARKLIKLRMLFPTADVSQMISRRPTLLLDEEFDQVGEARAKLIARLALKPPASAADTPASPNMLGTTGSRSSSGGGSSSNSSGDGVLGSGGGAGTSPVLDGLVSRQPLLLVKNVDSLLDELERLLPAVDVVSALLVDPDIIMQVMCNRNLSLW